MYRSSKVKIPDLLIIIIKKVDTEDKKNKIYERKWMIYTNPKILLFYYRKTILTPDQAISKG